MSTIDRFDCIRVEMSFNSLTVQLFEDSDLDRLIQNMFAHIKAHVENSRISESGFAIDRTVHPHINFHKLALTRGSSSVELL